MLSYSHYLDPQTAIRMRFALAEATRRGLPIPTPPRPTPAEFSSACGIPPDPWQQRFLASSSPRILLNCSRQVGKSTTAATKALYTALHYPGSLILCLAPAERQSKEIFRKITDGYRALGRPVESETENKLELELANGSRVVALPGKEGTIRGLSGVSLLLIDEAARVADDLYKAVRPMLAVSKGQLIALSTPFGKQGWWWEAWENGGADWERVEVPATECPRIAPEFLAEELRALGPEWYAQEYFCQFTATNARLFDRDLAERALRDDYEPLWAPPAEPPKAATIEIDPLWGK